MTMRAYIEPICAGGVLTPMPLYLEPRGYVLVPLEETYTTAFAAMPAIGGKSWKTSDCVHQFDRRGRRL